jgi:vacuolar-type H+-ATPase subunit E/Vma4
VVPDARVSDGAVASTMDGSARVYNRINDRLQQARPLLTSSIARMLWG